MFVLTTVTDRIRVAAAMLSMPTLTALHNEIDLKYPNRILMNVGLVICRYGSCLKITNGSCVPGDGGSHHECLFRLVVFRPFVDEVCVGKIVKSTPEGLQVSLGNFYHDIFIPAYWMLRPSRYSEELGLWSWTPDYGNEDDDEDVNDDSGDATTTDNNPDASVKMEDVAATSATNVKEEEKESSVSGGEKKTEEEEEEGEQFEMELGAEIRFKIKSIHFTQVTNTAKGVQATTTTTAHSQAIPKESEEGKSPDARPLRKRSLSVEISDMSNLPASMNIVASICEDGLGLTSWWTAGEDNDEEEEEEEEGAEV
uniref:RNA polymerase III subunit Rpc25 domain-containing protein n=1 Tax=Pseudo-nitzschia australis TaxID=44445 RepID=A0A7S4AD52_9STRA|mmetsp:Transcript_9659/g.20932  ORF Transcript_9659/g.20932 Transcript_9659/m.20932 type:complete len:312 (-) Transcript_9659:352-1287(-)|eukprot:CAMPEP_0168195148 /NCGR_PEP_ID=MMETSP0139_2-20121125/19671_1 /TAXON_ID=44445 /ORGANISM="Pseudo-nitzschia australis, Strain 10249 10 AB" /LENGTH=311 /DNA_ID=CAMNT_0008118923 /DNA_START=431 /DNA_END=1366 /DNA_ORIENTATION=+